MGKVKDQMMGDDQAMGNIVHSAHDPLCPLKHMSLLKSGCPQCNLIALARDDETNQIRDRHDRHSGLLCSDSYRRGFKDASKQIELAIYDLQDVANSGEGIIVQVGIGAGTTALYINRERAIDAIKALGVQL